MEMPDAAKLETNKTDIIAALSNGDPLALLKVKSRMDDDQIARQAAEIERLRAALEGK